MVNELEQARVRYKGGEHADSKQEIRRTGGVGVLLRELEERERSSCACLPIGELVKDETRAEGELRGEAVEIRGSITGYELNALKEAAVNG